MLTGSRQRPRFQAILMWIKHFRYLKFGIVGAGGTGVNIVMLYMAQEHWFVTIADARLRLYASLALAILVSTVHNFGWNRRWTWSDRIHTAPMSQGAMASVLAGQFGRYAVASWLGIALQYGLTLWLSCYLHYLLANVIAIVVASFCNFWANDHWTFAQRTLPSIHETPTGRRS